MGLFVKNTCKSRENTEKKETLGQEGKKVKVMSHEEHSDILSYSKMMTNWVFNVGVKTSRIKTSKILSDIIIAFSNDILIFPIAFVTLALRISFAEVSICH